MTFSETIKLAEHVKSAVRGTQILKLFKRVPSIRDTWLNTPSTIVTQWAPRVRMADTDALAKAMQGSPGMMSGLSRITSPNFKLPWGPATGGTSVGRLFPSSSAGGNISFQQLLRDHKLPVKHPPGTFGRPKEWGELWEAHPRNSLVTEGDTDSLNYLLQVIRNYRRSPSEWI